MSVIVGGGLSGSLANLIDKNENKTLKTNDSSNGKDAKLKHT